jgi:predicted house-cleaning noncanonical NTP pyrophosphatase (MazG superfamily)
MKYNKLVRDKIPAVIKKRGGKFSVHIAGDKEYWSKLTEKLTEETNEFIKEPSIEEIADINEVIDAIIKFKKYSRKELIVVQKNKAKERGGFKKRIILEQSE